MNRIAVSVIASLLLITGIHEAVAHAFLDRSEPRVGNSVTTPPRELRLWFTENLEAAFSTVMVSNAAGERVDTGKPRIRGNQMSVSLRPIGKGVYRVMWRVLSVDTHTSDGNFTFTVGP